MLNDTKPARNTGRGNAVWSLPLERLSYSRMDDDIVFYDLIAVTSFTGDSIHFPLGSLLNEFHEICNRTGT